MAGPHYQPPSDADLKRILKQNKIVAVVGLSNNPTRPSYAVARYLQEAGYCIIPVNPKVDMVLGEKAYPDLEAIPGNVDVVDVFRRAEYVPEIVAQAIRKGARVLWLQEGIVHYAAARQALTAGLEVVMDRCMLKEHRRLLGK